MLLGALFCPQNTEDVYTGEEQWVDNDTVICNKRITRGASEVRAPACLPASLPVCLLLNPVLVLFGMLSPPPSPCPRPTTAAAHRPVCYQLCCQEQPKPCDSLA